MTSQSRMIEANEQDGQSTADSDHRKASAPQDPVENEDGQDHQETSSKNRANVASEAGNGDDKDDNDNDDEDTLEVKLYKSTRFKGYLTIAFSSIINQNAAALSTDPAYVNAVPASPSQQSYAQTVAIVSSIISGLLVVLHLDRYSPFQKIWIKAFAPKSKLELAIIGFLLVWWSVATIVQTGVRGIAGDGKEQYNLYMSTWLCCYTTCWTMERKLLEFGYPTLQGFVTSWPYRAPGWIAILAMSFFTVFWYVDLFINTAQNPDRVAEPLKPFYSNIPKSQYQWLILVASLTLLPSGVFVFAELVRKTNDDVKGHLELILEGFCLFLLTASWIPSVIVATTPGGFASLIGNAYFFTWGTTIYVVETFVWFIHDFRGNVHKTLEERQAEYRRHQQKVLEKSRQYLGDDDDDHIQDEEIRFAPTGENSEDDVMSMEEDSHVEGKRGNDREDPLDNIYLSANSGIDSPPRFQAPAKDRIKDYGGGDDDDSVKREIMLKESNSEDYYSNLDDILE